MIELVEPSASWIVYEDEQLVVVNKPSGVPSQAAEENADDDLPTRLKRYLAKQRGVAAEEVYLGVHQRLDQDTSGLLLFSLRKEANAELARQLEMRNVVKRYVAVVSGDVAALAGKDGEERVVEHFLVKQDGLVRVSDARDRLAKRARLRVRTLRVVGDRALVQVTLETGRTHQIRVQLAALGAPVAGDALYGTTSASRLMLHACELSLSHPEDSRPLELKSEVPLELSDFLEHGARSAACTEALCTRALSTALQRRYRLLREHAAGTTTAFRLLHDAADGFPGLAVELFANYLVLRVIGEASEAEIETTRRALGELGCSGIYLKRHPKQGNELVDPRNEVNAPSAPLDGEAAPPELVVEERGLRFSVRLAEGIRTGLFLDQRDNRQRIRELAGEKRVLNLFAYTGSFSVAALLGGARDVLSVDVSRAALAAAERHAAQNGDDGRHRIFAADAFDALERLHKQGQRFDVIVVDPPSCATTKRGRFRVAKDFERLCRAALAVLEDEGQLLACVNHHEISQAQLRRDVHAAVRAVGFSIVRLRDLPTQRDFPAEVGHEPWMKSVLATFGRRGQRVG